MISTILLASIFIVLIYKCYKMEIMIENITKSHNALVKTVNNNANVLNVVVNEVDEIMEDIYEEKGEKRNGK